MQFNENINRIFNIFKEAGYQIYLVGGCVRDMIMGFEPHDYDFTTNATPVEMELLADSNNIDIIPTGEQYGTMTFKLPNGELYEITTFRADGDYSDGRRPDQVKFSNSLEEDLKRRDFTINALAMDSEGNIIDLFGGQEDIKNHIIRAIGDPDKRFREDALRIMRAIRFAYRYQFSIDFATENAIVGNIKNLKNVSQERIDSELIQTLKYKSFVGEPSNIFERILTYLFIQDPNYDRIVLNHRHFTNVMDFNNYKVKLTYFNISAEDKDEFYKNCKFSNELKKNIQNIVDNYDRLIEMFRGDRGSKEYCIRKCLSMTTEEDTLNAIYLCADVGLIPKSLKDEYIHILNLSIENHDPISLKDLAVNGDDLIRLGYKGKQIGEILNDFLDIVLCNPRANNEEYLLEALKNSKV